MCGTHRVPNLESHGLVCLSATENLNARKGVNLSTPAGSIREKNKTDKSILKLDVKVSAV